MNKIKDLLYDKNDILVAILIVFCAILVISTRINAIMTYSEKIFSDRNAGGVHIQTDIREDSASSDEEQATANGMTADVENDDASAENDDAATESGESEANAGTPQTSAPVSFSLYISYGESMNQVAKDLVELGLFETAQEFFELLDKRNVASKVQIGNFIIPSDATKDEVVKIITSHANGN